MDRTRNGNIISQLDLIKNETNIKSSFYEPESKLLVLLAGTRVQVLDYSLRVKSTTSLPLASSCEQVIPGYMQLNSEFSKIAVICKLNSDYFVYYIDPAKAP